MKNYSRHKSGCIHSPAELRTYPGLQIQALAEQIGLHVSGRPLVRSRYLFLESISGHCFWQPSSPQGEYISFGPQWVAETIYFAIIFNSLINLIIKFNKKNLTAFFRRNTSSIRITHKSWLAYTSSNRTYRNAFVFATLWLQTISIS